MSKERKNKRKYERLRDAVIAIYSAAMWLPDRHVENENEMWKELRDAAGIEPGSKRDFVYATLREK